MKKNYTLMKTLLRRAKALAFCSFAFMATMSVNAQTWSGTTDTDFATATNWVGDVAPIAGGAVTINPATNNPIVAPTTSSAFSSLSLTAGATLEIQGTLLPSAASYTGGTITINGGTLNVNNNLYFGVTNNPGTCTINSGTLNTKVALIVGEKGEGILNINGGTVTTGSTVIIGGYYAASTVNLNGGTLVPKASLVGSSAIAVHEAGKGSPLASGVLNIDGGKLVLGGDQTTFVNDYVTAGKIIPAAGKQIVATFDSALNVTNVTAVGPKKIAYVTKDVTLGTGASTVDNDAIFRMFNADSRFAITVIKEDAAGTLNPVDFSQYDLLIIQETFGSGDAALKPAGPFAISKLTIPVIYNKAYALRSGKALTASASSAGDVADLAVTVPVANQSNPLFTGITFSGESMAIFNAQANDNGTIDDPTKLKSLQYVTGLELSNTDTCKGFVTGISSPDTSVAVSDIPGGTTFGTGGDMLPSTSRMIAFAWNYGAIAYGDGTNLTANALKLWENAALILTGQSLGVNENTLASDSISVSPNPTNGVVNVSSASDVKSINVFDTTGKQVLSATNTSSVNLSNQATGVYLVQVQTENGSTTKKVILE